MEEQADSLDAEDPQARHHTGPTVRRQLVRVLRLRRMVTPAALSLSQAVHLRTPHLDDELATHLADAADRIHSAADQLEMCLRTLDSVRDAHAVAVDVRQNDDTRRISALAAIVAVPAVITGVYGMNFDHMPELHWLLGYPFALVVMALPCVVLFLAFRRSGWL
jgi:magnesium transporter